MSGAGATCSNCGYPLPAGTDRCGECGAPRHAVKPGPHPPAQPTPAPPPTPTWNAEMTGETAFERSSSRLSPSPWPARLALLVLGSLAAATVGLMFASDSKATTLARARAAKLESVRLLLAVEGGAPTGAEVLAATGGDPVVLESARVLVHDYGLFLAHQAEQTSDAEEQRARRRAAANAFQTAEHLGHPDAPRLRAECLYPLIEDLVARGERRGAAAACREVAEAYRAAAESYDRSGRPEDAQTCRRNAATVADALAELEGSTDG